MATTSQNALIYAKVAENYFINTIHDTNNNAYEPLTTCMADLAIASLYGENAVRMTLETYHNGNIDLSDYKVFTELCIAINLLSWFTYSCETYKVRMQNGNIVEFTNAAHTEEMIKFLSQLYYEYVDKFYDAFEGNSEANEYFFEMTD